MANISGTVSIIQLSDLGMAKVFEVKAANPGKFTVQLPVQPGQSNATPTQANFHWSGIDGLDAVYHAVKEVLKVHPPAAPGR
jgi:hypothetical protein